ncbi:MAG: hypothetical protein IPL67_12095 [Ignavibacteria bacterium]|nr:hypothetical protein [Ignavibacteria bacterium]
MNITLRYIIHLRKEGFTEPELFFETYGRFYTYLGAGAKMDDNQTFVWSADAEVGYEYNGFSASVGAGKYDDPFYSNVNVFLNLTKTF